jgi:hypothetical protein
MKKYIISAVTALTLTTTSLLAQVNGQVSVPYISYEVKMGKGFDAVQANCLTCHSFGYVINQGRQSRAHWKEKVDKMIYAFKAPMTQEDADTVTEYLYRYYGNGKEK